MSPATQQGKIKKALIPWWSSAIGEQEPVGSVLIPVETRSEEIINYTEEKLITNNNEKN